MGTPVATGTWSGDTNGTMSVIDYSADWTLLNERLNFLITAVNDLTAALTTSMTTLNTQSLAAFGPGGSSTPGMIAHAIKGNALANLDAAGHLAQAADNLNTIGSTLQTNHDDLTGKIGANLATLSASASVMIAQGADKAAFEKAATQAALKRSNLPEVEVPQPDIEQTIKKSITDAGYVSAQTKATGFITDQITDALQFGTDVVGAQLLKVDFIADGIGKWEQAKLSLTGKNTATTDGSQQTNNSSAVAVINGAPTAAAISQT